MGLAGAALVGALSFAAPHPSPMIPALIYLLPVALATVVGGRVAGAAGLAASALGLEYLFLPPVRSWSVGVLTTVGTDRARGWLVLAVFVAVGAITIELVARERDARRRARVAESRLTLLSEASAVLSQSFDYEKTLAVVAQLVSEAFRGACIIRVRGEDDRPERLVTADPDPGRDARLHDLLPPLHLGEPDTPGGHGRGASVQSTDAFLRAAGPDEANLAILAGLRRSQWIVAPLLARDKLLGAFAVAAPGSLDVPPTDVDIVEDLADRMALAVMGALLFADQERARDVAMAAAGRTARLQSVTAAIGGSVSPDEVGAIISREARAALRADRAALYELSPIDGTAVMLASDGFSDVRLGAFGQIAVSVDRPLPTSIVSRGVAVLDGSPGTTAAASPAVDERFPRDAGAVVAPLLLKGRLAGHLYLGFDSPRVVELEDLELLRAMTDICAQTLDRAHLVQREQSARAAAEQSALRLSLVSQASALLAVELDYPRAYTRLAELLVERIADLCLIDVWDGEVVRRVAAAHSDPARKDMVDALRDRYPPLPERNHPVFRVLRSGQPEMASDLTDSFLRETVHDDEHLRIVRELGFRSFMCVPLAARGRILGTITLVSTHPDRRYGDDDLHVAQEVARRAAVRIDNARLYAAEQDARRAAEAASSLSAALSESASMDEVFDVVTHGMRDALGAASNILALLDSSGRELQIVRRLGTLAPEVDEWTRFRVDADLPLSEAVRIGGPVIVASEEERRRRYRLLGDFAYVFDHSIICLPLQVEGRAIGGIALGYPDVRSISPGDTRLAMTLAGQGAQALERARVHEAERKARREAEGARERLSFLADASRVLSTSLDRDLTLSRLAHLAVPGIADWCAVDVVDEGDRIRRLAVAHADPQKAAASRRMEMIYPPDAGAGTSAARVIRTGISELIPDATVEPFAEVEDDEVQALLHELGLRSAMIVPLPARGNIVGAISFALAGTERRFGPEDLELAEDLARRAGVAVDNARLYQERDRVAHTLQQSLLPQRLPAIPGLEFEGRYHALGSGNEVGGDFYDVFDSGNGTWGMTIGDVCGKGPEAAAVMGVVRYTLRAAAMHEDRPSSLLLILNEVLRQHLSDERFCTVAYVRIRPGDRRARLTVCLAGHPPPLIVRADGRVERAGTPGTILGVFADVSLSDVTVDLDEGDAMVLFTDGVTDERRGSDAAGEAVLERALSGLRGASAAEIGDTLDRLIADPRSEPPRDDAAILVARVIPAAQAAEDRTGSPP